MNIKKVLIFSGPSGVGKDTVLLEWYKINPNVNRVITHTTRCPREGEVNGVDYHFVEKNVFLEMIDNDEFFEFKEVYGNYYGTTLKAIDKATVHGCATILKIDVQGALECFSRYPGLRGIFLTPPTLEELENRLRLRGSEDDTSMVRRLAKASWEMDHKHFYTRIIVNDNLLDAVQELDATVKLLTEEE